MVEKSQLPYLVTLVDDEASEVRDEVLRELSAYGANLEMDLEEYSDILESNKIDLIYPIIEASRRTWLKENWNDWTTADNEYLKLEIASGLIARFQFGLTYEMDMGEKLNELTTRFIQYYPHGDEFDLAYFLFKDEQIEGEKHDFYNPLNSNVLYALNEKRGLPITLSIIYMLVGKRLSFNIEGCNFPGHFLTKFEHQNNTAYIDCFNGGKTIYEDEIREMLKDTYDSLIDYLKSTTNANTIMKRVVNNLINAYKENSNQLDRYLFSEIYESTPW